MSTNKYFDRLLKEYNNSLERSHPNNHYTTSLEKEFFRVFNKPLNYTGIVNTKDVRHDIIKTYRLSYIKQLHYSRNELAFRRFYINNKMPKLWQRDI